MQQFEQSWQIKNINFHLVEGDIFQIPVQAIVNSEQTDFHLHRGGRTISSQIWHRFGQPVQMELNRLTGGVTLAEGTVLETNGGNDYLRIYHAGFHHPWKYLYSSTDDEQTEYVRIIRSCVRQILDKLAGSEVNSVAFPLIGCGLFGLAPALLAYDFMSEVAHFAESASLPSRKDIWLIIYQEELIPVVLNPVVQALIDRAAPQFKHEPLTLGVDYLDLFEREAARSHHPEWSAWLLARYCELLTGFLFFYLAVTRVPPVQPQEFLKEDCPVAFGTIRAKVVEVAGQLPAESETAWGRFFADLIRRDQQQGHCLDRINMDRNNIAHGRQFRSPDQIWQDLLAFVNLPRWQELLQSDGKPGIAGLAPWVLPATNVARDVVGQDTPVGVLERWGKTCSYVVPHTGTTFKVKPAGATVL